MSILNRIRTNNIIVSKNNRKAYVYATRTNVGRKHKDIKQFTGLMFIDVDKCIDHIVVKDFFKQIDHTVAVWYSSSGKNVHALIKIPICSSIEEYKRRYKAFITILEPYIKNQATIDKITSNPTQLAFESFDPNIYINNDPIKFESIFPVSKEKQQILRNPKVVATKNSEQWCFRWVERKINHINDNGYTQLLSISRTYGGYCSGGYVTKESALKTLKKAIQNNHYLNGKYSSGSLKTYLKGAEGAFNMGLIEPLRWNNI